MTKKDLMLTPQFFNRDPLGLFRQMTSELDRIFETPRWPSLPGRVTPDPLWAPDIDVYEKDKRLIMKVDLPGLKKEDVKVEFTDGYLTISGERKREIEEKKDKFYRCEREYGSFYRAIPLPEGVVFEDVKATFIDGVLEISVPLLLAEYKPRKVEIHEAVKTTK